MHACTRMRAYACDGGRPRVGLTACGPWMVSIGDGSHVIDEMVGAAVLHHGPSVQLRLM